MTSDIPAGWYPDPRNREQQRYWNGQGWTHDVRGGTGGAGPAPAEDPVATAAGQHGSPEPSPGRATRLVLLMAGAVVLVGIAVAATLFFTGAFDDPAPPIADDPPPLSDTTKDDDVDQTETVSEESTEESPATDLAEDSPGPAARPETLLAELQESGTVRMGVANEIPFGYVDDDGEATGIAPDVARAAFAELGIDDIEPVVVSFGELITGLQAGHFDVVSAGMFLTPERAQQVHFSDPDYCITESVAVPDGNPSGVVDHGSLAGSPEIVVGIAELAVQGDYLEDAGVARDQIVTFDSLALALDALQEGSVDAVASTHTAVTDGALGRRGVEVVDPFLPQDPDGQVRYPCGAHAFADEELRDAFNDALSRLKGDGSTAAIILDYPEFSPADVDLASDLTREDVVGR